MKEAQITKILNELIKLDTWERQEVVLMLKAQSFKTALNEIQEKIFRPARKHGYREEIEELIKKCGQDKEEGPYGDSLIGLLEKEFYNILKDYEILDLL